MSLTRSLSFLALSSVALSFLGLSTTACDEAAKLVDANNAQPGEADGRAVELTTSPSRFNAIAVDDTNMIVVQENGDVHQRARSNEAGAINKIGHFNLGTSGTFDAQVAFDKDFIYIVTDGGGLHRMPRAGGDGEKLDDAKGESLALADNAVFYISLDTKTIRKLDKATKEKSDYATGYQRIIAVALDGDKVWIADRDAETISWVPTVLPEGTTSPTTPTVVVKDQSHPNTIGIGPDHVYWSNGSLSEHKDLEDKIYRVKKDGSGQPELVTPTEASFVTSIMHADASFLYFGQSAGGIMRVPVNASGAKATKFLNICENGFALSSDSVYVVENNANRWSEEDKSKPNRLMAVTK